MGGAVAAEWRKLRTVRSTYGVLGAAFAFSLFTVLLALQLARTWDGLGPDDRALVAIRPVLELAGWVGGLCLAILGVLSVTSEYRTGMVRLSLVAVPHRGRFLAAKALVVGAVALAAGQVTTVGVFLATRPAVGDRPIADQRAAIVEELPGFAVSGLSVVAFALFGLGLGVLLRSAAGAIAGVVLVWHVLPVAVFQLPSPWDERAGSVMLSGLPAQISGRGAESSIYGELLPPVAASAVLAAYALVPLAAGTLALRRRDA
ncbi:ABC transporter permease [Spirillospora sp. NPDC052242]